MIPFPGTPDASPRSPIIFSSLRPGQMRSVTVTGSKSGVHRGHLTKLPDGAGVAFFPDHPFRARERVNVVASLTSGSAGTASGDPGARSLRFSFRVGVLVPWGRVAADARAGAHDGSDSGPVQRFRSAPSLRPPLVSMSRDPDTSSGDIFLTPHYTGQSRPAPQSGPMILDSQGRLLWFHPVQYATNLQVQHYRGHPVLTWWQRVPPGGGEDMIVGRSYRRIAALHAPEGYVADIHEFQLTARGTALIDAYAPVKANLTSVGGSSSGTIYDCVIQELDIKTGTLLWEWHALGHVPIPASLTGRPGSSPYDYFHLNSIQRLPDGNLLISARNTWAVYEIDKQTGKVIWTLGGRYSDFKVGWAARFEWQHDARLHPDGILSLFDDAVNSGRESQSSAKVLKLNTSKMTASLVRRYTHRPPLLSVVEGSTQVLSNRNVLVGWGDQPDFSEYSPGGRQILNGSFPLGVHSYRAYRFAWHARPPWRPSVAVRSGGPVTVYASWNGATQVAWWRVLGGPAPGRLHRLGRFRRSGFETTMVLHSTPRYVAVQALNARRKVLGASRADQVR